MWKILNYLKKKRLFFNIIEGYGVNAECFKT